MLSIPRDLKVATRTRAAGRTDKINAPTPSAARALTVKDDQGAAAGSTINHVVNMNFGGFRARVKRGRLRLRRRRPPLLQRQRRRRRRTRRSTSSPATRSCAARRRWTTCASATRTPTSCAPRASRTSCARPRSRSASARSLGDRNELLNDLRPLHAHRHPLQQGRDAAPAEARRLLRGQPAPRGPLPAPTTPADVGLRDRQRRRSSRGRRRVPPRPALEGAARRAGGAGRASAASARRGRAAPASSDAAAAGEDQAIPLGAQARLPRLLPALCGQRAVHALVTKCRAPTDLRPRRKCYRAYRIVVTHGDRRVLRHPGHDLADPPILDNPSETAEDGGSEYYLFYDGSRLRLVGWQHRRRVYWVSNTLLQTLRTRRCWRSRGRSRRCSAGRRAQ